MVNAHQVGKVPLSSMGANHPMISARRYFEEPAAYLLSQGGPSPARLVVDCSQNTQRKIEGSDAELDVEFDPDEYEFGRLAATLERRQVIEFAAVGLALLFLPNLADGQVTEVVQVNGRTDYWVNGRERLLEVSGTQDPSRLRTRHTEKVVQGGENPRRRPYFVSVSSFVDRRSIFSFHEVP